MKTIFAAVWKIAARFLKLSSDFVRLFLKASLGLVSIYFFESQKQFNHIFSISLLFSASWNSFRQPDRIGKLKFHSAMRKTWNQDDWMPNWCFQTVSLKKWNPVYRMKKLSFQTISHKFQARILTRANNFAKLKFNLTGYWQVEYYFATLK